MLANDKLNKIKVATGALNAYFENIGNYTEPPVEAIKAAIELGTKTVSAELNTEMGKILKNVNATEVEFSDDINELGSVANHYNLLLSLENM